ncbi:MAG TPA: MFS transporter [Candidatus Saccharimonadia bacterium]|nr:MFS transporter [Candidatus Saccharimonadia bacterium]
MATPSSVSKISTLALIILLLGVFMDLLDASIINIAIPTIGKSLNASPSALQWSIDAYLLGLSLLIVTGGRLGDLFGRKKMFLLGTVGFTAASALAGCSTSADMLIAARLLQGVAAALMVPQVLAFIQVLFAPKDRAKALGAYSGVVGFATVGGPLLAAGLIQWNLANWGWRTIFFINLPVGLITLLVGLKVLPESKSDHATGVDFPGIILATAALTGLLYPLIQGRELGWPLWTFALMAGSVAVGGVFLLYQQARSRAGKTPLVNTALFRAKGYGAGVGIFSLFMIALSGYFLAYSLYLQLGLHFSALKAALATLPFAFMVPAMAGVAVVALAPKMGRKVIGLGIALCALGIALADVVLHHTGANLQVWQLIAPLVVGGAGMGMLVAPITDFALANVPEAEAGSASGFLTMMQQVGSTIGVALLSTIFFNLIDATYSTASFTHAITITLLIVVAILVVILPAVLFLPRKAHAPVSVEE